MSYPWTKALFVTCWASLTPKKTAISGRWMQSRLSLLHHPLMCLSSVRRNRRIIPQQSTTSDYTLCRKTTKWIHFSNAYSWCKICVRNSSSSRQASPLDESCSTSLTWLLKHYPCCSKTRPKIETISLSMWLRESLVTSLNCWSRGGSSWSF